MLKDLLDLHKLFRTTKSPDTNIDDENRYMGFPTSKYDSCSIHYSLAIFLDCISNYNYLYNNPYKITQYSIYNFVLTAMLVI